jgi:hypothetical protein
MERHPVDPLSFAIGGVLVVLGIAGATGSLGRVSGDGAWILPVVLGLVAVALVLGVVRRSPTGPPPVDERAPIAPSADDEPMLSDAALPPDRP